MVPEVFLVPSMDSDGPFGGGFVSGFRLFNAGLIFGLFASSLARLVVETFQFIQKYSIKFPQ